MKWEGEWFSNNGDNGPPPNGFWLTKGKDDDCDDDNADNVADDDNVDDGDKVLTMMNNGTMVTMGVHQNQMGLATSERSDVGSQSFLVMTIILMQPSQTVFDHDDIVEFWSQMKLDYILRGAHQNMAVQIWIDLGYISNNEHSREEDYYNWHIC